MENIVLIAEWMNAVLDRLAVEPHSSYDQIITFLRLLTESVTKKISNKEEFSVSEFLVACIGYFIFYDLKDKKYCLPVNLHERNSGTMYHRSLNYLDIMEAKERFNVLLNDLLKKLSPHCDLNKKKSAFSLFELLNKLQHEGKFDLYIQRDRKVYIASKGKPRIRIGEKQDLGSMVLIPPEFIQYIFYDHYGLDPKIAEDSLPLANRYNAEETAQKLSISKNNLIKTCLDASLGAYINSGQFKIRRTAGSRYNQEIIEAFADISYPYKYHGLVRLSKPVLQALYSEKITTNDKPYSLIRLQPSLAEVIQTFSLFIELRGKQQIIIDDLFFIEDEILAYLRKLQLASTATSKTRTIATDSNSDKKEFMEKGVFSESIIPTTHQDVKEQSSLSSNSIIDEVESRSHYVHPKFKKHRKAYNITYKNESHSTSLALGFSLMEELILNPTILISSLDLIQRFNKARNDEDVQINKESVYALEDQGINADSNQHNDTLIDDKTKKDVLKKIDDLKTQKQKAIELNNMEKAEKIDEELEQYIRYITSSLNHKGNSRSNKTPGDKAREAVQKNISRALDELPEKSELHQYLKGTIKTGLNCIYIPIQLEDTGFSI